MFTYHVLPQGGHIKRYIMQGIKAGHSIITAEQICEYFAKHRQITQPRKGGKLEARHFDVIELSDWEKDMRPQSEGVRILYKQKIVDTKFRYAFSCPWKADHGDLLLASYACIACSYGESATAYTACAHQESCRVVCTACSKDGLLVCMCPAPAV